MKKLIFLLVICSQTLFAKDVYLSASLSAMNSPFSELKKNSYSMVEAGFSYSKFSTGLGFGNGSLNFNNDWFIEPKISVPFIKIENFSFYMISRIGAYIRKDSNFFIECGVGTVYSFKHFDLSTQISNWDSNTYFSIGILKTIKLK